jgi:hypothetical protein
MKITAAASHFDKTFFTDAYAPGALSRGLLDVSDASKRDGLLDTRHIFSVAASISLPARNVIQIGADAWVLGRLTEHTYMGQVVRKEYDAQRTDGPHNIQTPAQLLDGTANVSAFAGRVFLKDLTDQNLSSDKFNYAAFYLSLSESVARGYCLTKGSDHWRVMSWYEATSGYLIAECVKLEPAVLVSNATFTGKAAYDPGTDTYGDAVPISCPILLERYQDNYHYVNAASDKFVDGDMAITVSKTKVATMPVQANLFSANGTPWKIMDVTDDGMGAWVCHCRPF